MGTFKMKNTKTKWTERTTIKNASHHLDQAQASEKEINIKLTLSCMKYEQHKCLKDHEKKYSYWTKSL